MVITIWIVCYHFSICINFMLVIDDFFVCSWCARRINNKRSTLEPFKSIFSAARSNKRSSGRKPCVSEVYYAFFFVHTTIYGIIIIVLIFDLLRHGGISDLTSAQLVKQIHFLLIRHISGTNKCFRIRIPTPVLPLVDRLEFLYFLVCDCSDFQKLKYIRSESNRDTEILMLIRALIGLFEVFCIVNELLPQPFNRNACVVALVPVTVVSWLFNVYIRPVAPADRRVERLERTAVQFGFLRFQRTRQAPQTTNT